MKGRKVCLFLFILCLRARFYASQVYLPSIILALDKSLQYYADNYMRMNLDGIFGLRVLEGSFLSCYAFRTDNKKLRRSCIFTTSPGNPVPNHSKLTIHNYLNNLTTLNQLILYSHSVWVTVTNAV